MATYKEIQDFIQTRHGTEVQTCWIAHVKEQVGLPMRSAANRQGSQRVKPCPPNKKGLILEAMRELGVLA
ncbi:MAG: hypothetical protein ABL949_04390 [Fimbriimonadaceae bacterium]